jgi:hypothetical protein
MFGYRLFSLQRHIIANDDRNEQKTVRADDESACFCAP